jgi:hypothetical protein
VLDPPEHEGKSHRQASQLTFSLSYMVRIAMIRPPAPETSMSMAGACPEWALVLHAFFDGELDSASSSAMSTLLRGNEKVEIHEAEIQVFRHRVGCSSRVARSMWLIAPFEGAFAAGFGGTAREQRTPFRKTS